MKSKKGFTLIELLLYIAIVAIVVTSLTAFAWNIVISNEKNITEQEVYSQARFISEKLKFEIRNALSINSVTSSQISLAVSSPNNPTVIYLSGNNLMIQQGANTPVGLNSQNTKISSLIFANNSSADGKAKNISFILTVESNYPSSSQQYKDSITISSDAELRSN